MSGQTATMATSYTTSINDETLAHRVRRALEGIRPLHALGSPFYVQVSNGVVTLRGVVATYSTKAQILHTVRNVPGVQQIFDKLWV